MIKTISILLAALTVVLLFVFISFRNSSSSEEPSNLAVVKDKEGEIQTNDKDASQANQVAINTENSSVNWSAKKIASTSPHKGAIEIEKGSILFEDGAPVSGSVTIDMTTITNEDVKNEGMRKKLISHLESDDFFSVNNFPKAEFAITEITELANNLESTHQIVGDLTIKGKTKQISFPAKVALEGEELSADASFSINRADWDVRFGSNSFFDNLGDEAIDDYITFEVHLET